jgi:hypothetical protein
MTCNKDDWQKMIPSKPAFARLFRTDATGNFCIGSALVVSITVKPGEVNEPTLATLMPRLASY